MGPTSGKQGCGLLEDWGIVREFRLYPSLCNKIAWHIFLFWGPVSDWRLGGCMVYKKRKAVTWLDMTIIRFL